MSETALWILLIVGQVFSAGNMNYQQRHGYYEINKIYPRHPSMERIVVTKGVGMLVAYGLTKRYPKHKLTILKVYNIQVYGFIINDKHKGISMSVEF